MRIPWFTFAFVLFAGNALAAMTGAAECHYTTSTLMIDGRGDDDAWKLARQPIGMMIPVSHEKPERNAAAKLLWDDHFLYVLIVARDRDLRGTITENDKAVYVEDCLEIFLSPTPASDAYCNFEINLAGGVFDQIHGVEGFSGAKWNCAGLKRAIITEGTVNHPADDDVGWTLEVAIPFECLSQLTGTPAPGAQWSFHLSRYDYDADYETGKILSSTAPLTRVNYHYKNDWAPLVFVKSGK